MPIPRASTPVPDATTARRDTRWPRREILAGAAAGGALTRRALRGGGGGGAVALSRLLPRPACSSSRSRPAATASSSTRPARLLAGQVMYRDFFEFVAPGTAHLDALVLRRVPAPRDRGPRAGRRGARAPCWPSLVHAPRAPWSRRAAGGCWPRPRSSSWSTRPTRSATTSGRRCSARLSRPGRARPRRSRRRRAPGRRGALLGAGMLFTQDLGAGALAGVVAFLAWPCAGRARRRAAAGRGRRLPLALALRVLRLEGGRGDRASTTG